MPFRASASPAASAAAKPRAADMFAELGAAVVDTDEIAHELTAPGGAAHRRDRATRSAPTTSPPTAPRPRAGCARWCSPTPRREGKLEGDPASADPRAKRARASRAADRAVRHRSSCRCCSKPAPTAISRDRVLVVDCAEEQQVERACAAQRPRPQTRCARIMAAQLPRAARLARADDVLAQRRRHRGAARARSRDCTQATSTLAQARPRRPAWRFMS